MPAVFVVTLRSAQPEGDLRDRLAAGVWVTNRTDLNGSSSPISYHVEELVFEDGADALR